MKHLQDNCRWDLKLNGERIDIGTGSDMELDSVLKSKLKDIEFLIGDLPLSVLFSLTPKEIADKRIEDIKNTLEEDRIKHVKHHYKADGSIDPEEEEIYYEVPGGIGTTRFITSYGMGESVQEALVPPFDQETWRKDRIKAYMDGGTRYPGVAGESDTFVPTLDKNGRQIKTLVDGVSEAEAKKQAEKIVDTEIASWKKLSETGTAVHAIFEQVLGNQEVTTPDPKLIPQDVFESLKQQAIAFKSSIEATYPDCTIYTEMGIKSKFLTPEWADKLGRDNHSSITGIIDLLVVDKNGVAHLYDYKVSRKAVGQNIGSKTVRDWWNEQSNAILSENDFWHTTKKRAAEYQLCIYADMLRQYGFKVDRYAKIVPIKMNLEYEDDGFTVKDVKSGELFTGTDTIDVDVSISSTKGDQVHTMFRKAPSLDIEQQNQIDTLTDKVFPHSNLATRLRAEAEDRDYYKKRSDIVQTLKITDEKYPDYKYAFKPVGLPNARTKYYKTEEELDKALDAYIVSLKDAKADRCRKIAELIHRAKTDPAVLKETEKDPEFAKKDFLQKASGNNESIARFLELQFERYINDDWEFAPDEELNSYGILTFKKWDENESKYITEIVVLTTSPLRNVMNLGMGTSILGKTTKDININKLQTLPAMTGYLELMKALIYVGLNPEAFEDTEIAEIRAVNIVGGDEISVDNDRLLDNYNQLYLKNRTVGLPKIDSRCFMNGVKGVAWSALDHANYAHYDRQTLSADRDYWTSEKLKRAANELKKRARLNDWNGKPQFERTEEWIAYKKLYEAYNIINGFYVTVENDVESIFSGKGISDINGLLIASPQYSSSANIRSLGKVIDQFSKEVHADVLTKGHPLALKFRDLYEKYGTGAKAFNSWFERDAAGNLDPRFMLKDPNSAEFDGDPLVRETMTMMLDTLARLKNPRLSDEQLAAYRKTDEYRQVPLLEAKFSRQLKGVGLRAVFSNKMAQVQNLTEGMFGGEGVTDMDDYGNVVDYGSVSSYVDKHGKLYNKFELNDAMRRDRINKYGIGMFETDLELVFNNALVAYSKANLSEKYIPIITGMKIGLQYADTYGGTENQNMENITTMFDKIVRSKFYGESIVEGKHLRRWLQTINLVKSIFTTMTLSLNTKSFFRESLQGVISGMERARVKLLPGVDAKIYEAALWHVVHESPKNLSGVSMLQQLNMSYGMANQSLSQLAQGRRVNWLSVNHWGKDTLFLTASAPDFMHRMSILVAKMMADKCWTAHSVDENNNLVYDWEKDERFAIYRSGDTSNPEYLKQKSLYLAYIDAFTKEGFRNKDGNLLKEGDALPQAYTRQEGQSIKNYADLLYGHYDDESRSLLCDTFMGAIFLQYKTFVTAKLEQWAMKGGVYNTETLQEQRDEVTGELIYQKFYEDETGAHRDFLLESEYNNLSEEEKAKCRVYYEYTGIPMEGMLNSTFSFMKALVSLSPEEIKKIWDDPTKRAMLRIMLHDMWLMMLAGFFINFVFSKLVGNDEEPWNGRELRSALRKTGPALPYFYNILHGATEDSQIHNIISNFTQDPPVVSSAARFAKSSWDLFTGDHNLVLWATKNIGAIREFQGLAEMLNEE